MGDAPDLVIRRVRLCECGKPAGHASECFPQRGNRSDSTERATVEAQVRWSPFDTEMREILFRLELVSNGSTQAWNSSGGQSGEPDDKVVTQAAVAHLLGEMPAHLAYRVRYERASTEGGRARIVTEAREELKALTRRIAPMPTDTKTLADVIIEESVGYEPRVVAQHYGVDPTYVRRTRMRAGRDPETGRVPRPVRQPDIEQRRRRAQELRERGLTVRQIAMHLRVSPRTIQTDLAA